jgi:hypothetical protein
MATIPIRLNVIPQKNGNFDISFEAGGSQPGVTVGPDSIKIVVPSGHDLAHPVSHDLVFTFLDETVYQFSSNVPPILWADPPLSSGSTSQTSFKVSGITRTSCTLTVSFPVSASGPTVDTRFFFYIEQAPTSNNLKTKAKIRTSFIADPVIVTDPDPG